MPCNITARGGTRCSRQAATNYRPAGCAPEQNKSLLHRWLNFSGGFATSDARAALPFLFFTFLMSDPKSSASAELAQACARRARATLCNKTALNGVAGVGVPSEAAGKRRAW